MRNLILTLPIRLSLGSSDCSCCGATSEQLLVDHRGGRYEFRLDSGCMGGAQFFYEDKEDFLDKVEGERSYFMLNFGEHGDEFDAMVRAVTAHVPVPVEQFDEDDDDYDDDYDDDRCEAEGAAENAASKARHRWS